MADEQTYSTHRRWFPMYHFFVIPLLSLNLLVAIAYLIRYPSKFYAWSVVMAVTLIAFALTARLMALRVQDRVIRLEERLRLQQILPEDLRGRIGELRPRHLVGLRFCDDAEAPELCRAILNGELKETGEIKRRIKKWRPDYMRA